MADHYEVLGFRSGTERSKRFMHRIAQALQRRRMRTRFSPIYSGASDVLFIYGIGSPERWTIRKKHLALRPTNFVVTFDIGYFIRSEYYRMSLNVDHPQQYLDLTPNSDERWRVHVSPLRNDRDPDGHIILVGLGRKTRAMPVPGVMDWEQKKAAELTARFPGRTIYYRPKPGSLDNRMPTGLPNLNPEIPIEQALRGAALVVTRHSNVAVDAVIAGVPFEADDGAAKWLDGKAYTPENRQDFLHRLSYWQWKESEADECIDFALGIIKQLRKK